MINSERQYNAYSLVFIIENKIRVAMHNILVKTFGIGYFDNKCLPNFEYEFNGELKQFNCIDKVKSKKNNEPKYIQKSGFSYPYLWYTEYSELVILLDHFWETVFFNIFLNPKNIRHEFIEKAFALIIVRNSVAHNRYINQNNYSDLESFKFILDYAIQQDYLSNYDELVFNKLENLRNEFEKRTSVIESQIEKVEFIKRDNLRNWRSLYSALMPNLTNEYLSDFEELYSLLELYNKNSPNKPGRSDDIKLFIRENGISEKIKKFKKL